MPDMQDKDDFDDISFFDRMKSAIGPVTQSSGRPGWPSPVRYGIFVILALFILSVIWTVMSDASVEDTGEDISRLPLLTASSEPYRIRPDDPGGMDIPNRDSTIFEAIDDTADSDAKPVDEKSPSTTDAAQNNQAPAQDDSTGAQTAQKDGAPESKKTDRGFASSKQFAGLEETLKTKLGDTADTSVVTQPSEGDLPSETMEKASEGTDISGIPKPTQEALDKKAPDIENLAELTAPQVPPKTEKKAEPADKISQQGGTPTVSSPKPATKPARQDQKRDTAPLETPDPKTEDDSDSNTKETEETLSYPNGDSVETAATDKAKDIDDIVDPILARDESTAPQEQTDDKDKVTGKLESSREEPAETLKKAVSPPQNGYFVQLGSVTSQDKARAEWQRLQSRYASQLAEQDYRVQEADLGERGVFYRIQAGPFSQNRARAVCKDLKEAGKTGGCLVVAP